MQASGDAGNTWGSYYRSFTGGGDPGDREPGTRRKRIAGYLKAANDLRQSYYSGYANRASEMEGEYNSGADQSSGSWPDMEVTRSGDEELVLFPSYARRRPDEDNVVDVEIRGWLFAPHSGPLSRKNRYLHWVALKLCGLPAQASTQPGEPDRDPTAAEAEAAGDAAAAIEKNGRPPSLYSSDSRMETLSRTNSAPMSVAAAAAAARTLSWRPALVTSASTQSLPQVPQLDPAEVASAHAALAARLAPFMHRPIPNARITITFSDESSESSQSFTVLTSETGHFSFQEDLPFIPTTVRVIASEKISATEDVIIHEPTGISLISDIDDTVKHSAVSMGAREIFRNTFTEPLSKLSIPGVSGWYKRLSQEPYNVNFHYVSNSPWQLYPVLKSFFEESGLPPGSMHLKEYSGMLQGIFEPVAERKKGTVERVIRDFPQRQWILVGDSGEADLEVYTEIVEKFPGRILAVFIRDVTTTPAPDEKEFFNPNESPEYAKAMQEWAEAKAASVKQPKIPPPIPPKRKSVNHTATTQNQPEEHSRETSVEGAKTPPPRPPKPSSLRDTMTAPAAKSSSTTDLLCTRNSPPPPPPPRRTATFSPSETPSTVTPAPGKLQHPATTASSSPAPITPNQQQQQAQQEVLLSKREELWNRRWERALMIMGHYDVQLHSWRTGGDVEAMCRAIVEKALWE